MKLVISREEESFSLECPREGEALLADLGFESLPQGLAALGRIGLAYFLPLAKLPLQHGSWSSQPARFLLSAPEKKEEVLLTPKEAQALRALGEVLGLKPCQTLGLCILCGMSFLLTTKSFSRLSQA